eukprot:400729-Rhodomonas_salina.5
MEEGVRGGGGGGVRQEAASGRAHGSLHSKPGSTVRPRVKMRVTHTADSVPFYAQAIPPIEYWHRHTA